MTTSQKRASIRSHARRRRRHQEGRERLGARRRGHPQAHPRRHAARAHEPPLRSQGHAGSRAAPSPTAWRSAPSRASPICARRCRRRFAAWTRRSRARPTRAAPRCGSSRSPARTSPTPSSSRRSRTMKKLEDDFLATASTRRRGDERAHPARVAAHPAHRARDRHRDRTYRGAVDDGARAALLGRVDRRRARRHGSRRRGRQPLRAARKRHPRRHRRRAGHPSRRQEAALGVALHAPGRLQHDAGPPASAGNHVGDDPPRPGRHRPPHRRVQRARARRADPRVGRVRRRDAARSAAARAAGAAGARSDVRQARASPRDPRRPLSAGVDRGAREAARGSSAGAVRGAAAGVHARARTLAVRGVRRPRDDGARLGVDRAGPSREARRRHARSCSRSAARHPPEGRGGPAPPRASRVARRFRDARGAALSAGRDRRPVRALARARARLHGRGHQHRALRHALRRRPVHRHSEGAIRSGRARRCWSRSTSPAFQGTDLAAVEAAGLDKKVLAARGAEALLQHDPRRRLLPCRPASRQRVLPAGQSHRDDRLRHGRAGSRRVAGAKSSTCSPASRRWKSSRCSTCCSTGPATPTWTTRGLPPTSTTSCSTTKACRSRASASACSCGASRRIVREHSIVLPADLTLMFKALITMEGLGRQYDPEFHIVEHLDAAVAQGAARALPPGRARAPRPQRGRGVPQRRRQPAARHHAPGARGAPRQDAHRPRLEAARRLRAAARRDARPRHGRHHDRVARDRLRDHHDGRRAGRRSSASPVLGAIGFAGYALAFVNSVWVLYGIWRSTRK